MRLLAGWAAGCCLVLAATAAFAQGPGPYGPPYARTPDFDDPYYTPMAPRGPLSRGDGMALVPPHEVFAVMREAGFMPTGVPRLRGFTYVINAIDRRGGDGRLVVDARTGEIVNFVPSEGYEEGMTGPPNGPYGPRGAAPPLPPPPMPAASNVPRPPAAIPRVASRTVPQPQPRPAAAAARPEAAPQAPQAAVRPEALPPAPQQPATPEARPAPVTAAAAAAPTVGQARPAPLAPQIMPTQPMPEAQGLEY